MQYSARCVGCFIFLVISLQRLIICKCIKSQLNALFFRVAMSIHYINIRLEQKKRKIFLRKVKKAEYGLIKKKENDELHSFHFYSLYIFFMSSLRRCGKMREEKKKKIKSFNCKTILHPFLACAWEYTYELWRERDIAMHKNKYSCMACESHIRGYHKARSSGRNDLFHSGFRALHNSNVLSASTWHRGHSVAIMQTQRSLTL